MPSIDGHEHPRLQVAIVGGGIIGVMTALGLLKRNIDVKIYEQARSFRELGAGVAFTASAIECMKLMNPHIAEALYAVGTLNGGNQPNDYIRWHDGYSWDPEDPEATDDKLLYTVYSGYKGFQACHRAHLLDELVKYLPPGVVEFGKRFVEYEDRGPHEKLLLRFQDGSTFKTDAVIGCDGIKSKVRQNVLGADSPTAYPHFSHKVAYRALIPMEKAESALGSWKARNQHMHTGPRAHIMHYPVSGGKMLNMVVTIDEEEDWPLGDADTVGNMTAPATRDQVDAAFKGWGPTTTKLLSLLPEQLSRWAIFDMYDHPAPTYVKGRVCLAGDAAHASSPHHGAGAVIGVEDGLALCTLLGKVQETLLASGGEKNYTHSVAATIERAFSVYDAVRLSRSQWLVKSSREACDIYDWIYPATLTDWDKCSAEITQRSHTLWFFDVGGMLNELDQGYKNAFVQAEEVIDRIPMVQPERVVVIVE